MKKYLVVEIPSDTTEKALRKAGEKIYELADPFRIVPPSMSNKLMQDSKLVLELVAASLFSAGDGKEVKSTFAADNAEYISALLENAPSVGEIQEQIAKKLDGNICPFCGALLPDKKEP